MEVRKLCRWNSYARYDGSDESARQGTEGCNFVSGFGSEENAIDAGCRDDIPEDMVNATIMKELKTVQEQIDSCPADRTDLLEEYRKRYDIMKEYAPKMLSKEEVTAIVKEKFADVIATKNKGQIMKTIMPELKGKADGKVINEVVTEMCNA